MPRFKEVQVKEMTHDTVMYLANQKRKLAEAERARGKKKTSFKIVSRGRDAWKR